MQVPQEEDEEEAVAKKAIKELEIFISQIFYSFLYLFLFFNYFTLSLFFFTFFTHDIYPHPHPRPTTSTHDPRPTTFSYTLLWVVVQNQYIAILYATHILWFNDYPYP